MQHNPKASNKRRLPIWIWFALALLAGLLIGWFALGWESGRPFPRTHCQPICEQLNARPISAWSSSRSPQTESGAGQGEGGELV